MVAGGQGLIGGNSPCSRPAIVAKYDFNFDGRPDELQKQQCKCDMEALHDVFYLSFGVDLFRGQFHTKGRTHDMNSAVPQGSIQFTFNVYSPDTRFLTGAAGPDAPQFSVGDLAILPDTRIVQIRQFYFDFDVKNYSLLFAGAEVYLDDVHHRMAALSELTPLPELLQN